LVLGRDEIGKEVFINLLGIVDDKCVVNLEEGIKEVFEFIVDNDNSDFNTDCISNELITVFALV
jgi:hypothetical protein